MGLGRRRKCGSVTVNSDRQTRPVLRPLPDPEILSFLYLEARLADEGRSLLCITHNVDNVEQCHLILVLARGKLVYFGPLAEAGGTTCCRS